MMVEQRNAKIKIIRLMLSTAKGKIDELNLTLQTNCPVDGTTMFSLSFTLRITNAFQRLHSHRHHQVHYQMIHIHNKVSRIIEEIMIMSPMIKKSPKLLSSAAIKRQKIMLTMKQI